RLVINRPKRKARHGLTPWLSARILAAVATRFARRSSTLIFVTIAPPPLRGALARKSPTGAFADGSSTLIFVTIAPPPLRGALACKSPTGAFADGSRA